MKAYIVVEEGNTSRGFETKVSETAYPHLETAKIELVEKVNAIKANPIPYFGYARKEDLRKKWLTDRMVELKDWFSGDIINVYIHEINVLEP